MVNSDKKMIHVLGQIEQNVMIFHLITQNGAQFKIYKLFISGIFHLMFSNHCWTWVTETVESETMGATYIISVSLVSLTFPVRVQS